MSRPPTRGSVADASGPRAIQQPNDDEAPNRPTRNAPRIFSDGTILYSTNRNSIVAGIGDDEDVLMEEVQRSTRATPQATNSTHSEPPQRKKGRASKTNVLELQAQDTAPIVAQLRQGRVGQTKGIQDAFNKIMAAMERQEQQAEKRYNELHAKMQELEVQNEQLRGEIRECKEKLLAGKDAHQHSSSNLCYSHSRKRNRSTATPPGTCYSK